MKHPTIKQLDYVIGKLKSVLPQASKEGAFNMSKGYVYSDGKYCGVYQCNTVHCTGGWYAVANIRRKFIKNKYVRGYIGYENGAELMANDLGFKTKDELTDWAHENSNIWDNKNGDLMFSTKSAYNNPGFDGVVKQFEIVRSNLMKLKRRKL